MDTHLDMAAAVPAALEPRMTAEEQALLAASARGRGAGIEFGCGGSTGLMLAAGIGRLTSVDSDETWLRRVGEDPRCVAPLAEGRLRLQHAGLGATGAWGWPQDVARMPAWPGYWRDAWEGAGPVDLVLVDGRFRVACALNALPRLAPGGVLLVHDFWMRAAYQGPVLRHADIVDMAGELVALRPRPALEAALIAADLAAYSFDPR